MTDNVLDILKDKAKKISSEPSRKEENYNLLLQEILDAGVELAGYIADNVNIGEIDIDIETVWIDCNGDFMIHGGTKDFEAEEFESIKFWKITGPFGNTAIVKTEDDIDSDGLHNDEFMQCCKIEQLNSNQEDYIDWLDFYTDDFTWNPEGKLLDECYIPVYAIPRICEKILNPDGSLDYYDVPESHAINMMNLNLELNDEDIKNIDGFVNNLNKKYPDGFDIKWDEPSIGSPYFDPKPEFGLACDCVTLRIYKK